MSGITFASNSVAGRVGVYLDNYQKAVNTSIERISSGKKFNSASDSPGETGYINRFRSAIMSTKKLTDNLQDNISMLQTADYSLSGTGGISSALLSIREKVIESQNTTLTSQDKENLQQEIEDIIDEIGRISSTTEFNTKKLLNGETGASLATSDSGLAGYATDRVSSGSYYFTDILGATQHLFKAGNAPSGTADTTGSDYDYTKSLGTTGTITLDGSAAAADEDYDMVFTSTTDFEVYNSSGTLTASGSVGTEFTVNGVGITVDSDGSYKEGFKYNFSLSAGNTVLVDTDDGNRGLSANTSITNADWGTDAMMNSSFDIKFQYDSGTLKYAAYDIDGNRMGSLVESGSEFTAYSSSKLDGSTFTFTSADAGVGDTWRVDFANYSGLSSAGGTISIGNASDSFSVSYTGNDKLSDIVSSINANGADVASAELDTSSGSSVLNITAEEYGDEGKLSISEPSGNLVSTLGLAADADTGNNATLKYNEKSYESSTGYFYDIEDNMVFEVANDADIASGYISVSDRSVKQATNINGPDGVEIFIRDMSPQGLGLVRADDTYALDVTTSGGAQSALTKVDSILGTVDAESAKIGSLINSIDSHTSMLDSMRGEYESNLSLHEDTDFAEETTNYYLATAGRDAAAAMHAQANLHPSRVLQLLGIIQGT